MKTNAHPLIHRSQNKLLKTWMRSSLLDEDSSIAQRIITLEKLISPIVPKLSFQLCSDHIKLERTWMSHSQDSVPQRAWIKAHQELLKLHKVGIVHWDVRPSNLIWDGVHIWLIDWEPSLQQIRNGRSQLICSPDWMAPADFGSRPSQLSDIVGLISSYFHHLTNMMPDVNLRQTWEDLSFSEALNQIDSQLL